MQKTKKSIAKRFKITASGKVLRRSPGKRHLLVAKSVKQKRAMGHDKPVTPGIAAIVKKAGWRRIVWYIAGCRGLKSARGWTGFSPMRLRSRRLVLKILMRRKIRLWKYGEY